MDKPKSAFRVYERKRRIIPEVLPDPVPSVSLIKENHYYIPPLLNSEGELPSTNTILQEEGKVNENRDEQDKEEPIETEITSDEMYSSLPTSFSSRPLKRKKKSRTVTTPSSLPSPPIPSKEKPSTSRVEKTKEGPYGRTRFTLRDSTAPPSSSISSIRAKLNRRNEHHLNEDSSEVSAELLNHSSRHARGLTPKEIAEANREHQRKLNRWRAHLG